MSDQKKKQDEKRFQMPHTYVIIFFVVMFCWALTFMVPVGKFDTHDVTYTNADGKEKTKTVLLPETFRLQYPLDNQKLAEAIKTTDAAKLTESGVDAEALTALMATDPATWESGALDEMGLSESTIHKLYDTKVYDTTSPIKKQAKVWGTEDFYGFGVFNYMFEGLVTGDKWGSAVGIVAFILVIGGAFGIIMRTGAIDAGIYEFITRVKGAQFLVIPALFIVFSLGGAIFGMSEESIPFAMIVIPFVIAMGYDSLVGVAITFVATQVGNATSWMNPFGVAIAQGIAGVPVLSGATFRIIMWVVLTTASVIYITMYANKIKKDPTKSIVYDTDQYFRDHLASQDPEHRAFTLGHGLVLLWMLFGVIWIVWGVTSEGYYIPEIASQFFVMGLGAGVLAVVFKLNNMRINDIASSFQSGAGDLVGAAMVVGMAKGILLVLGGSSATTPTVLNTILSSVGSSLAGLPSAVTAVLMYTFQTIFNFFVTSNSGQAALTMPILAPLSDIVGISRQVAVLCYQLGSGFADAIVPTSASLMGVLGVARMDWTKWAKFQIKMQGFFFVFGSVFIVIAIMIGYN
jgi:uncharacterized ion transporter superfamily protein YfcC